MKKIILLYFCSLQEVGDIVKFFLEQNLSMRCADKFTEIGFVKNVLDQANITINRDTMRGNFLKCAEQIYNIIKEETKNKLISIMFDSASRNNRHVFGVNICYRHEGKFRERVLGVLTQTGRQFGSVLAAQVIQLLEKIEKTINDIYVTCTDNGANMIKTSDILLEAQKELNLIQLISDEGTSI